MTTTLRDCPAPAKLNLFLHITGRRPDGYHQLQTVFQLIDWGDVLHFNRRDDGAIHRVNDIPNVPEDTDLTVRAARMLQAHTGTHFGADIEIDKRLPMGGGIGGGSSDAATTLLALNHLWDTRVSREDLQKIALKLGADVPFFIFGRNAFAGGVGEELEAVELPARHFLVIVPNAQVPTVEIFSDPELTRDTEVVTMTDFLAEHGSKAGWPDTYGRNDMQTVAAKKYAEVAKVLDWLDIIAASRMTGSGACVFAAFPSQAAALEAQAKVPSDWKSVVTASLQRHPLYSFAS
ncbi:4-(cytidine 5'-diphospho)-2-C-methyl-D-erythritol kinase [Pararobbsia alpina]|jgi:4-diphosphocytidyl-2-C-methyl-D-erythritol kinase|uniref:4-(cytidine 5'-diphospho)-2-C-methyl-D-erythritol kinase n=1 Tax=Pararobbsia alpina TaxID=621374 RepID=UPI0039A758C5